MFLVDSGMAKLKCSAGGPALYTLAAWVGNMRPHGYTNDRLAAESRIQNRYGSWKRNPQNSEQMQLWTRGASEQIFLDGGVLDFQNRLPSDLVSPRHYVG